MAALCAWIGAALTRRSDASDYFSRSELARRAMIPQSIIQDLLARADIVEVVGRTVKLKKSGSNWQGLCPFHNEKSPSFTVSPSKQFYHCFGCGAHGSAIGFLMEIGGLSYVEAINDLASSMGLSVPREPRQGGGGWQGRRDGGGGWQARSAGQGGSGGSGGPGSAGGVGRYGPPARPGTGPRAGTRRAGDSRAREVRGPRSEPPSRPATGATAAREGEEREIRERGEEAAEHEPPPGFEALGDVGSRSGAELMAEAAEAAAREAGDDDVGFWPGDLPDGADLTPPDDAIPPAPLPPAFADASSVAPAGRSPVELSPDALLEEAPPEYQHDGRHDGKHDSRHDGARDRAVRFASAGRPGPRGDEGRPPRLDRATEAKLFTLLQRASDHYRAQLRQSPRAIDYLKARGLTGKAAATFGLGFAPDGWRGLEALASAPADQPDAAVFPYADKAFVDAGLVITPESGKRYDRFRDRIMFPIRDMRGRVIGFGGRVLDKGEPKYLNSPETPVFIKGRELYGLFEARQAMRQTNEVLVVEGYMDVVMLHQHGLGQAVAALGTATTEEHVIKLSRMVDRIVFAFDGDAAGRRAAGRALLTVLPRVSDTRRFDFLFLPPEHDPDSFIQAHGLEAFTTLLAEATPLSAFILREVGTALETPEDRARALARFKPMVLAMPDSALRVQLIHAVADRVGFGLADLLAYLGLQPPRPVPSGDGWRERRPWQGDGRGWQDRGRGGPGGGQGLAGGGGFGAGRGGEGPGRDGRGGRFGRHDRFGRDERSGTVPRTVGAAPVPLTARICGLLATHPDLAHILVEVDHLPATVLKWRAEVAAQPEGVELASVVAALRDCLPRVADVLLRAGNDRLAVMAELSLEQAQAEYLGALKRLEIDQLKAEKNELVRRGLESEGDRARYGEVQRRLLEADRPPDDRGAGESGVLDI